MLCDDCGMDDCVIEGNNDSYRFTPIIYYTYDKRDEIRIKCNQSRHSAGNGFKLAKSPV